MILVLPVEVKKREFIPKLFLSYNLIKKFKGKLKIILGSQSDIHQKLNIRNCIYIDKGSGTIVLWLLKLLKKQGNLIYQLDEEGPICGMEKFEKLRRYPKEIYEIVDNFFAWGKKDILFFKKNSKKKKFHLIGHPKFDLLEKKNIKIFEDQVKHIKKKYNNFIFFASSFSHDGILNEKISKKYVESYLPRRKNLIKNDEFQLNERKKDYLFIIDNLKKLSDKNKNLKIIFRPHPVQDIEKVKKRFIDYKNIIVDGNYTITPWIISSKLYIHSGCTTSFEACKLKKKSVLLVRNFRNIDNIIYKYGVRINKFKKLNSVINNQIKINFNNTLEKEVFNIKKLTIFSDKFLKQIKKEKLMNSSYDFKVNNDSFLKNMIFKLLSIIKNTNLISSILPYFFSGNILLSKEYKKQKFGSLDIAEIKNNLKKFDNIEKNKIKVNIKMISKNIFELKR